MKKIVKLTESDLVNIIKKVINESSPVEKAKSPCPGQKVCWLSANTPAGCCPVGYTCANGGCERFGDYSSFAISNSTPTVKEAISLGKDKRKCICKPEETMVNDFPCTCRVPMTPITP